MAIAEMLIFGGIMGSIYALLALGFSLSYGVARVLNLAHGTFFMIGAYLFYSFSTLIKISILISLLAATMIMFIVGVIIYLLLINLVRESVIRVLLVTLSYAIIMQQVIRFFFGAEDVGLPSIIGGASDVLGVVVENQRILSMVVSLASIIIIWTLIKSLKFGKAIQAVAQDSETASLMGINTIKIYAVTLGISSLTAGLAGILLGPFLRIFPGIWIFAVIISFAVVILGGLGSIWGTVLAAFIVAYAEIAVAFMISSSLKEIVPLIVIAVAVLVRPQGLLGKVEE